VFTHQVQCPTAAIFLLGLILLHPEQQVLFGISASFQLKTTPYIAA
jgi:hypothetical protein